MILVRLLLVFVPTYFIGSWLQLSFLKHCPGFAKTGARWGLGILSWYPIGVVQIFLEGQNKAFSSHYLYNLFLLWLTAFVLGLVFRKKRFQIEKSRRSPLFWLITLTVLLLFSHKLGLADINSDERLLSHKGYHLVDGTVAARRALGVSFSMHGPLGKYMQHFTLNSIENGGFFELDEFELRFPGVIFAILGLIVFFDVSKELWGNRSALFGVVVLATCSLYIFSVRLAISHDLAYWNLFFLLALSGFVWWQKTKSRQSVLFMGLMCGALALVKFSGILLFIWLGLWLLHDALNSGRLKNLGWFLFIDLMLYVPVGFYNLAAFLSTGYVDVPTAIVLKKLGLPAKSLMSGAMYDGATDTAVKASLDLISTITDMTNPVFVAAFITSLIIVVLNRNKWALSFFGLIGLYCLFFVLVGFRAYYLSFFSILMVFVITSAASKVSATLQAVLLVFLIITSGRYSYNTFYTQDLPVEHQGEYGRSLEYIPKISLSRKNSLAIRSWLHNTGTKSFANWIKNTNSESYVYSSDISLEELRWYGKLDPVRAKLSENYRDEFELYKIDGFDLCNQEYLLVANKDKAYRVCGKQMVPLEESETTALFSQ